MRYAELVSKCGYPQELVRIANGLVDVPQFTIQAPADPSFGFPPVVIPLWSNGSWPGHIGLAKHWFGTKSDTYVQFYSNEFAFVEVAKNLEQLKAWLVFDFLCNVPDADEVGRFAESIGFSSADAVEATFAGCDTVSDLAELEIFRGNPPAAIALGGESDEPNWIVKHAGVKGVSDSLSAGQYEQAWYELNSVVLGKPEVSAVLKLLEPHATDIAGFQDLIACWSTSNIWPGGD